jgi:hypothetical protein
MLPVKMRRGLAAITETGREPLDGKFPAVSKNTNPWRCRRRPATSSGVKPSSRTGLATGRIKDSAIA